MRKSRACWHATRRSRVQRRVLPCRLPPCDAFASVPGRGLCHALWSLFVRAVLCVSGAAHTWQSRRQIIAGAPAALRQMQTQPASAALCTQDKHVRATTTEHGRVHALDAMQQIHRRGGSRQGRTHLRTLECLSVPKGTGSSCRITCFCETTGTRCYKRVLKAGGR